jgi:hypothetical protein
MKTCSAHLVFTAVASTLLLAGCDSIQDCDAKQVKESVVNLAEESFDKGLRPSEREALRPLRSTKVVAAQTKTTDRGVRTCTGKILITFNGPVAELLERMAEDGEKVADGWESGERAKLDDLRKRTLGIPPYSPFDSNAEIASRYADANMAFMKSSGELRRQIRSLREAWSGQSKGIELVSDYRVSKESSSGQFTVELSARELTAARNLMPLVLRARASLGSESGSQSVSTPTDDQRAKRLLDAFYLDCKEFRVKVGTPEDIAMKACRSDGEDFVTCLNSQGGVRSCAKQAFSEKDGEPGFPRLSD